MRLTVLCTVLAAAGAACEPVVKRPPVSQTPATPADSPAAPSSVPPPQAPPAPPPAAKVATVGGFLTPESVLHDTTQDIYFVSNINGSPTAKDNNGLIRRVRTDGAVVNLQVIDRRNSG